MPQMQSKDNSLHLLYKSTSMANLSVSDPAGGAPRFSFSMMPYDAELQSIVSSARLSKSRTTQQHNLHGSLSQILSAPALIDNSGRIATMRVMTGD